LTGRADILARHLQPLTEQKTAQPVEADSLNESGGEDDETSSLAARIDAVMSDDGLLV
jgi:hypothetical protein